MSLQKLTLYGYWRSGTSYRVRIALALKGIEYEQVCLDLRKDEHKRVSYLTKNPQGLVPAIQLGARVLVQSPAILEWLEETYPCPELLPRDADDRAWVRALAAIVGCDTHPLNNLRVLRYLKDPLGQEQPDIDSWISHWIAESFATIEKMIAKKGGLFSFGDRPTLADCYLVPQVYSALRFNVGMDAYPSILRVAEHAMSVDAFQTAHPDNQPDAD